jgi:hypothetical protein
MVFDFMLYHTGLTPELSIFFFQTNPGVQKKRLQLQLRKLTYLLRTVVLHEALVVKFVFTWEYALKNQHLPSSR